MKELHDLAQAQAIALAIVDTSGRSPPKRLSFAAKCGRDVQSVRRPVMREQRKLETSEDREGRRQREAQKKLDDQAKAEAVADEMIRRNVERYGP